MPIQLLVSLPSNRNIQAFVGALAEADFTVELAESGFEVIQHLAVQRPDLVILDMTLPDISGIEVCRLIRKKRLANDVPVILMTAVADPTDEVAAFQAGADDFVPASTSIRLLIHRILARLERTRDSNAGAKGFSLKPATREVIINGEAIRVTPLELRLLEVLVGRSGEVVSRHHLLNLAAFQSTNPRTIDVHIRGLRRKLGGFGRKIETVRSYGYRFSG